MKILITGATGRVGSRFISRILQRDDNIRLLVRQEADAQKYRASGVEVMVGDLNQTATIKQAVNGIDTVVHLAAFFRGNDLERVRATNAEGAITLAQASVLAGVQRFVFTSTNLVYGPGSGRPARENDSLHPAFPYPQTKVAAEEALQQLYHDQGLGLRILRLAFVYGEGDPHVAEFLPRLRNWHPAKRLHMVHHADVSQALLRAIYTPGIDGSTYNVADDAPLSIAELFQLNGQEEYINNSADTDYDHWEMIVNTLHIRDELGFRPLYPSYYSARDAGAL